MLAQTATGVDDALDTLGGTAVFEAKLDGARVQIHRDGDDVVDLHPHLDDVTDAAARGRRGGAARCRSPTLIADGEAIALRPDGRPHPFQVTASRFGRSVDSARRARTPPLSVFFFDVLHLDGADLLDLPAAERAAALAAIVPRAQRVDRLVDRRRRRGAAVPRRDARRRTRGRDGQVARPRRTRPAGAARAG